MKENTSESSALLDTKSRKLKAPQLIVSKPAEDKDVEERGICMCKYFNYYRLSTR